MENGCACHQPSRVRKRQRKNCPASAPSRGRPCTCTPSETTFGPPLRTRRRWERYSKALTVVRSKQCVTASRGTKKYKRPKRRDPCSFLLIKGVAGRYELSASEIES